MRSRLPPSLRILVPCAITGSSSRNGVATRQASDVPECDEAARAAAASCGRNKRGIKKRGRVFPVRADHGFDFMQRLGDDAPIHGLR